MVVFLGSSALPDPSLFKALGSTDGPSVCSSAECKQTIDVEREKRMGMRTDFCQEPLHSSWRKGTWHRLALFSTARENVRGRNHLPFSPHWHDHVHCDDLHPKEAKETRENNRSVMFRGVCSPSCRVASTLWSLVDGACLDRDSPLDCCTSVEYLSYYSHVVGRMHPIQRTLSKFGLSL
jgi:hypothetical protein